MSEGSAVHVLHVDEESAFADMVATFLEHEHDKVSVQTATSPTDGVQQLAVARYRL